jgi:hypothetical protein
MGKIPVFDKDVNIQAISSQCYTRKNFEDFVLTSLKLFYKRGDNGKKKITASDSYDKIYSEVKKEIKKFPAKEVVDKKNIENIQKILSDYKDKNSPNKLKYIEEISNILNATKVNIDNVQRFLGMTQDDWDRLSTRDICCYIQTLLTNDQIPKFNQAILNAVAILKTRNPDEVSAEGGDKFVQKYYNTNL